MAHVRQLIRDNVTTTLTGLTTTGTRVYRSRVYPVATTPGLAIYTKSESVEYSSMSGQRTQFRSLALTVEIYVKGVTGYDNDIDLICAEIETALYSDITRGGYARDTTISDMDVEFSGDGEQPLALATMTIEVDYITKEGAPSVAV